jgi:hypothetical protein
MQDYLGLADGAGTGLFKLDILNLALTTLHLHSQYAGAKKWGFKALLLSIDRLIKYYN